MQIMTKINDFEEIFFKSSIIFHVFAQKRNLIKNNLNEISFFLCACTNEINGAQPKFRVGRFFRLVSSFSL